MPLIITSGLCAKTTHLDLDTRLKLTDLQSITYANVDDSNSKILNWAISDFVAQWYYRVGILLAIQKDSIVSKPAFILKQSRKFKHKKRGTFSIERKGKGVFIYAWDVEGWSNALYTLTKDVLGVRWYWPNTLGLEWVGAVPKYFPNKQWRTSPSFEVRTLFGLDPQYAQRNRLNNGYAFNHNLAKIFKPEYKRYFPEAYANLGDRLFPSTGSLKYDPQPNFANETAVSIAALAAIKHFKENPNTQSFSLSPNDNVLFDTSLQTQDLLEPLDYFRGRPNFSDVTFSFANQVAHRVFEEAGMWKTEEGLPRYLCMLAYYWTEQVPDLELHPRIIPILTSDRTQWHDRNYAEADKDLIKRWTELNTEKLGAWDYYVGAPYPYPRQFNAYLAESLKYLDALELDIFFSQISPIWGLDGPKAWISAQLLWDSEYALEDLLGEFYREFFGAAEAPMRAFYECAERNRDERSGRAEWIKYYYDEAGIELFPQAVLKQMRSFLNQAYEQVPKESRFAKRIDVVSEAFNITERYAHYHKSRKQLLAYIFELESFKAVNEHRLVQAFEINKRSFDLALRGLESKSFHEEFRAVSQLRQSNPVPASLYRLLPKASDLDLVTKVRYQRELGLLKDWKLQPEKYTSLMHNPFLNFNKNESQKRDFLGPSLPQLEGWSMDFRASEKFALSATESDQERASGLRIVGADSFSLSTYCQLGRSRGYLLELALKFKVSPDSRIQFKVDWIDASENTLLEQIALQIPYGATTATTSDNGGYREVIIPLIAPKEAQIARVYSLVSRQYADDFLEIKKFNFLTR